MPTPQPSIREVLLELVNDMEANRHGGNLQQRTLLRAAADKLVSRYGNPAVEEAILTQWQELFRTGLLAWGYNLNNPDPPFFHLTEPGRRALANANRDPSNPDGYLAHLDERTTVQSITRSYLVEGLNCYVAGLDKAAAVMVGVAAESVVLDLRDVVVARLEHDGKPIHSDLKNRNVHTVTTALDKWFNAHIDRKNHRKLWESYESNWNAFTGQIRTARNEAGHPISIDPVTHSTVHAAF